jgi:hypothetical protein
MEVFLVFLLLIGAFNLGVATVERPPAVAAAKEEIHVSQPPTGHPAPMPCRYSRAARIQRDLTVAHSTDGTRSHIPNGDGCESRAD